MVRHLPQNSQCPSVGHNAKIPIPYLASMSLKRRSSLNPAHFPPIKLTASLIPSTPPEYEGARRRHKERLWVLGRGKILWKRWCSSSDVKTDEWNSNTSPGLPSVDSPVGQATILPYLDGLLQTCLLPSLLLHREA